jgi:hypothetical protein
MLLEGSVAATASSEFELLVSRLDRVRLEHCVASDLFGRSHRIASTLVEVASVSWRQLQLEPSAELGCVEIVLLLFRQRTPHSVTACS